MSLLFEIVVDALDLGHGGELAETRFDEGERRHGRGEPAVATQEGLAPRSRSTSKIPSRKTRWMHDDLDGETERALELSLQSHVKTVDRGRWGGGEQRSRLGFDLVTGQH